MDHLLRAAFSDHRGLSGDCALFHHDGGIKKDGVFAQQTTLGPTYLDEKIQEGLFDWLTCRDQDHRLTISDRGLELQLGQNEITTNPHALEGLIRGQLGDDVDHFVGAGG